MANIVVAIYNPLIRQNGMFPYFETFLAGLKDAGNNVLCFEKIAAELEIKEPIPEHYLEKIRNFSPDLFILFNNQFWDVSEHFDVPIVIYDVDSPNVFCNLEKLKKNKRYKYLTIQKSSVNLIREILEEDSLDVEYMPPFTGVRAEECDQRYNIGFCGSHWLWNDFHQIEDFLATNPTEEERLAAKAVYKAFSEDPFHSFSELYQRLNLNVKNKVQEGTLYYFSTRLSGLKRLRCLLQLADLGLEIRGYLWNQPLSTPLKAFPELLLSWSDEVVNNTLSTQRFYNSVKIGFNINHIQAKSGFSWRVCDILASNACLVSEATPDLLNLGFDVATYKTASEARDLCKHLLLNESLRSDYVAAAHDCIDKKFRFEVVLPLLEEFAGLSMRSEDTGTLEISRVSNHDSKKEAKKKGRKAQARVMSSELHTASEDKAPFPILDKMRISFMDRIFYSISKHCYKKIKYRN